LITQLQAEHGAKRQLRRYKSLVKSMAMRQYIKNYQTYQKLSTFHQSMSRVLTDIKLIAESDQSSPLMPPVPSDRGSDKNMETLLGWYDHDIKYNRAWKVIGVHKRLEHLTELEPIIRHWMKQSTAREQRWKQTASSFFQRNTEITVKLQQCEDDAKQSKERSKAQQVAAEEALRRLEVPYHTDHHIIMLSCQLVSYYQTNHNREGWQVVNVVKVVNVHVVNPMMNVHVSLLINFRRVLLKINQKFPNSRNN
jgi:hypothetical protein